jgi:hypothetical protein
LLAQTSSKGHCTKILNPKNNALIVYGMPFISGISSQFGYGLAQRQQIASPANLLLYLDAGNRRSYPGSGTTWTDLSANTNNATALTGATYNSANSGYLTFNGAGSGSLVSSKYNTTYTGKTIFVAGNLTSIATGAYRAMLGASAGSRNFNMYMYSPAANRYQLHYSAGGTGTISSDISYTPGNWFTAAITHSTSGSVSHYLNGALVDTQTGITFSQYSSSTELVGAADNYWLGPLSVIAVYKSALTAAEILANHNSVKGRYGLA